MSRVIRHAYSDHVVVGLMFELPERTKQSQRDEVDINNIMAKFQRTGAIDHRNRFQPQYGEVPVVGFQEAMQIVTNAESMFLALPSSLRKKFANDPAEFLAFVQDPANLDEMVELGLAEQPVLTQEDVLQPGGEDPPRDAAGAAAGGDSAGGESGDGGGDNSP